MQAFKDALDRVIEASAVSGREQATASARKTLSKAMAAAFKTQGTQFLARFVRHKSQFAEADSLEWEADFISAADQTAGDMADAIDAGARAAFQAGADAAYSAFSIDGAFDLKNPRAVAYLDGYGAAQVTGIDESTRAQMQTLISQAVDEGWSYGQLAKEIRARFDGFSQARATTIATYETGNAYEAGNAAAVAELADAGIDMEKSWLTVGDTRVSQDCLDNAAAGWIGFDKSFPSGHDQPLDHPNCRCTALYRRKGSQ